MAVYIINKMLNQMDEEELQSLEEKGKKLSKNQLRKFRNKLASRKIRQKNKKRMASLLQQNLQLKKQNDALKRENQRLRSKLLRDGRSAFNSFIATGTDNPKACSNEMPTQLNPEDKSLRTPQCPSHQVQTDDGYVAFGQDYQVPLRFYNFLVHQKNKQQLES